MTQRTMTLRISSDQAEMLDAVAAVEDRPIAEIVREAIDRHIESKRKEVEFQKRLRAQLARNKRVLERLARK